MTVSRRTTVVTAAALSAILALAACNGAEPVVGPTGSSSSTSAKITTAPPTTTTTSKANTTTPTPTVDPVLAKIPKAARPETMQGAEAFAKFYVNQINIAFSKPDPAAFDGLFDKGCKTCRTYEETAMKFASDAKRQSSILLQISEATASRFDDEKRTVNVFFTQKSVNIVNAQGDVVGKTSSGKGAFVFTLQYVNGHWTVTNLRTAAA